MGTIEVWTLRPQFKVALKLCFHQRENSRRYKYLGAFLRSGFSGESLLKQVKCTKASQPTALWWKFPGRVVQVEIQLVALVVKVGGVDGEGKTLSVGALIAPSPRAPSFTLREKKLLKLLPLPMGDTFPLCSPACWLFSFIDSLHTVSLYGSHESKRIKGLIRLIFFFLSALNKKW